MPTGDSMAAAIGLEHDPALTIRDGDPHYHDKSAHTVEPVALTEHPEDVARRAQEFELGEGEEWPTADEISSLRRIPDKIPWKIYSIAFVELAERLSYYGATQVFVNFIQQPNPGTSTGAAPDPGASDAQPGALGRGQTASTGITTFNQFWNYVTPLLGAYIADTFLGRYLTIFYAVLISLTGHAILTASAAPSVIAHPDTALGVFVVGIVVMGAGTGGFKPNISVLIGEQLPREKLAVKTLPSGERVIIDPAATLSRIYNYFYLFINVGALVGQLGMAYAERYVGFYLAFLLPTAVFATTIPVLVFCKKWYRLRKPEGSVLPPAVKLLTLGTRGRWHLNPVRTWKHMNDGTFWTALKPSKMVNPPKWMTFDDAWVDEVSRGWSACQVLLWFPLYWLCYNQINNNLTSQAALMQLGGVPNDVISNLDPIALIIFIPLMDLFVYPALRKAGIHFTPIKRITAGFACGCASMIWAAVIQLYIYRKGECGYYPQEGLPNGDPCPAAPITVWAQSGAYILLAWSEIFASIASLEYSFKKAPRNMRSLVSAFSLFMTALAAALGEAFLPLVSDPLVTWNYGAVGIIAAVLGTAFYLFNRSLDKQEDALNNLDEGHVGYKKDVRVGSESDGISEDAEAYKQQEKVGTTA